MYQVQLKPIAEDGDTLQAGEYLPADKRLVVGSGDDEVFARIEGNAFFSVRSLAAFAGKKPTDPKQAFVTGLLNLVTSGGATTTKLGVLWDGAVASVVLYDGDPTKPVWTMSVPTKSKPALVLEKNGFLRLGKDMILGGNV